MYRYRKLQTLLSERLSARKCYHLCVKCTEVPSSVLFKGQRRTRRRVCVRLCAAHCWEDSLETGSNVAVSLEGNWWLGHGEKGRIFLRTLLYLLCLEPCE